MKTQQTVGQVTFGASGRRWEFKAPGYEYASSTLHGGRKTATKIANIIDGAVRRTKGNGIDGLARANMNQVLHNASPGRTRVINHLGILVK
jgi:hypothetical protein